MQRLVLHIQYKVRMAYHSLYLNSKSGIYRVIQEQSAILCEMIVCVILSKKVHMNIGPILNGYRGSLIHWSARSPDLTPLDFCLWGWLKGEVYHTKVDTRAKSCSSHQQYLCLYKGPPS